MAISRMQFLRGDFSGRKAPLRPPWALSEADFVDRCTRCGRCADVCPTQVIQPARGGFPEISFARGECLFCGECVSSCTPQALSRDTADAPWNLRVKIDTQACIAYMGVECRGCVDPCEPRAIRVSFRPGAIGTPVINADVCTGCGACLRVCPAQALVMRAEPSEETV